MGAGIGAGMRPAQPGSQARGLRMRLCGEEDLSFALLLLASL